jgi:Cdc6-like AAA superfamily ATPase
VVFLGLSSKFGGWLGIGGSKDAVTSKAGMAEKPASKQSRNPLARGEPEPVPFPQFRATASDQLGAQAGSALARTRMKLLESFTPSQPVSDRKRFAGRSDVLTSVIRALEEQRLHVVVYGDRGLGKTSLMHVLTQAARDARYLVVYVSCGADSNFDEIFRTVASYIPMLFLSTVGPTSPEVEKGKTLAAVLPSTAISPRISSDILAKVVGTRIVVVLDEFDRCVSEEFRQNVAELIKNLSDRLVRVQIVIAGVAGNLTELLEHIPSIQRNLFAVQVPWMPASEIATLINNGADLCGLSFDEDAGNAVVSAAHGSPYLATLIGHHAGLNALDQHRVRVGIADVLAAISSAALEFLGRMSGQVRSRLKGYARGDMASLLGVVAGASLLSGGTFRKEDLWASAASAEKARRCEAIVAELVSSGILLEIKSEAVSVYEFAEDGVAAYLWLLSVESKLTETQSLASSSSGETALRHPVAVKLDRTIS